MKSFFLATLLVASTSTYGQMLQFAPNKSTVNWEGSKVVGSTHVGTLDIRSGYIEFKNKEPTKGQVVVNMKSIKNTDVTDPTWNKKLVGHLHSDDFFSTAKFPEARIYVDKFTKKGDGKYEMQGKLTIKNISQPITFMGDLTSDDTSVKGLTAQLEFDRTKFDVKYNSKSFFDVAKDKIISDTIKVKVDLQLKSPFKTASN